MEASLRLAKYLESLQSLPGQLAGNYDDIRRLDTEAQGERTVCVCVMPKLC